jgi:type IV secretion system protein TrbJ
MLKRTFIASLVTSLIFSAPMARAGSVAGFGGSTEITQLANNIELALSYIQQAQAYATQLQQWNNQIQQYQNMLVNTLNIPNQVWGQIQSDLNGLRSVVTAGQALAYTATNFGATFEAKYKGYQYKPGFNYKTEYRKWSQTTMDTLKNTLEAAGLQSNQFANEEGVLSQLRTMSGSAQGQMQAIQVGSQIAEQQVQQLQKLRQLMMLQIQSQNTYLATQQDKEDTIKAAKEEAYTYQSPIRPYTQFKGGSQ